MAAKADFGGALCLFDDAVCLKLTVRRPARGFRVWSRRAARRTLAELSPEQRRDIGLEPFEGAVELRPQIFQLW